MFRNTVTDARAFLADLVGRPLRTVGLDRPSRILRLEGDRVIVATSRSPRGQPVPIAWVQAGIDALERDRVVRVDVATLGHRSAFVGAALRELPGAQVGVQTVRLP